MRGRNMSPDDQGQVASISKYLHLICFTRKGAGGKMYFLFIKKENPQALFLWRGKGGNGFIKDEKFQPEIRSRSLCRAFKKTWGWGARCVEIERARRNRRALPSCVECFDFLLVRHIYMTQTSLSFILETTAVRCWHQSCSLHDLLRMRWHFSLPLWAAVLALMADLSRGTVFPGVPSCLPGVSLEFLILSARLLCTEGILTKGTRKIQWKPVPTPRHLPFWITLSFHPTSHSPTPPIKRDLFWPRALS